MATIRINGPIVSDDTATLYRWFGLHACSPETIHNALEEADGEDITLEINSPGGVCVSAYEMYTALMQYKGKVTAHVVCAMSAATLLVCAASEALISDTGIFMIHNARLSGIEGNHRELEESADALRQFDEGIINAYERKTGMSRDAIADLMEHTTYMGPTRAIELHFVDGRMFENGPDSNGPKADSGDSVSELSGRIAATGLEMIIPENKAREMLLALKLRTDDGQADSVYNNQSKGGKEMNLEDLLKEHPEAREEFDTMLNNARTDSASKERERIRSLDAIAGHVSAEAMQEAKYGENPIDEPTLAYQALAEGKKQAQAYMENAVLDSQESGTDEVGIGNLEDGTVEDFEAENMAAYINNRKGGLTNGSVK